MLSTGERITTDTNTEGLTKTDKSSLVYGFVGQGSRARNNTCLHAKNMAKGKSEVGKKVVKKLSTPKKMDAYQSCQACGCDQA